LILGCALLIQIADTSQGWWGIRNALTVKRSTEWSTPLNDPFWQSVPMYYTSIKRIPPGPTPPYWREISYLAARNGLSTDLVYLARYPPVGLSVAQKDRLRLLNDGIYEAETLFILDESVLLQACKSLRSSTDLLARIDGLIVLAPQWKVFNRASLKQALCPEQARALSPPQAIKSFPADLLQPGLSFSGIYDDGWIAEVARIQLGSEKKVGRIRITGEVPGFNRLRAGATIGVVVDGQEVARRQFRAGEFELEAAIPETEGPRWIEIRSDITDHLSAADQRVASILLKSIQLMESP
jgi:hypothetical protein